MSDTVNTTSLQENETAEEVDKYININRESTVTITGTVQKRTDDMINPNMKTGEIEIEVEELFGFDEKTITKNRIVIDAAFLISF